MFTLQHVRTALAVTLSFPIAATVSPLALQAQTATKIPAIASRLTGAINNAERMTLPGTASPRAIPANDLGAVKPSTRLAGITLVFSHSAAQQADLNALTTAQQDPASPLYHQWLTPAQFGARFGLSNDDIATATNWLQAQGFTVTGVSNSRDRVVFSGTAAQVATAFSTELHNYSGAADGEPHFAPMGSLSVPAALSNAVLSVENLSSFPLRSHVIPNTDAAIVNPNFTSYVSGNHTLQPGDVAVIYDIKPVYSAGFTGSGQIVVVGQSAIVPQDIANFQAAAGLPQKAPVQFLVPNSGSPVTNSAQVEGDLDIEYSGGIAPGAQIDYVYTGNSGTYSALDAAVYAIDTNLAPIVSISYGGCEIVFTTSRIAVLDAAFQQGAAQGQTIITAAGDEGSSDCFEQSGQTAAIRQTASADYPSASPFVTGLGGTEFSAAAVVAGNNTYFAAQSTTDIVTSALSYIPEQVWNDDAATNVLSAGGGGISVIEARPSWQAGVPGIPTGNYRLVPDISLDSSNNNAPYLYCSSASTTGSCGNGFRASTASTTLTAAGGTSFAAPIFAGMLSLISQAKGYTQGQGLVNPMLYRLASDPNIYASAFHDITSGGNQCATSPTANSGGVLYCTAPATTEYYAATGYDEASGIGSIDLNNLVAAWPKNTVPATRSFALAATAASFKAGTTTTIPVTVTPANAYIGTVSFTVLASTTADAALLGNACYSLANTAVVGTAAVTATLTIYTNTASCASGQYALYKAGATTASRAMPVAPQHDPGKRLPVSATLAGLLLAGLLATRRNRASIVRSGLTLAVVALLGFGATTLTGCSSGSTSGSTPTPTPIVPVTVTTPTGSYQLNIVGQDTTTYSITSNTTVTITVN